MGNNIHTKDLKIGLLYSTNIGNELTVIKPVRFIKSDYDNNSMSLDVTVISGNNNGTITRYGSSEYYRFSTKNIFQPIWKLYIKFGR